MGRSREEWVMLAGGGHSSWGKISFYSKVIICDEKCMPNIGTKWHGRVREQVTGWERNWVKFHRSYNESCIKIHQIFSPCGLKERHSMKKGEYTEEKRGMKSFLGLFSWGVNIIQDKRRNGEDGKKGWVRCWSHLGSFILLLLFRLSSDWPKTC